MCVLLWSTRCGLQPYRADIAERRETNHLHRNLYPATIMPQMQPPLETPQPERIRLTEDFLDFPTGMGFPKGTILVRLGKGIAQNQYGVEGTGLGQECVAGLFLLDGKYEPVLPYRWQHAEGDAKCSCECPSIDITAAFECSNCFRLLP